MEDRLPRMNNMNPIRWYRSSGFKLAVAIVFIAILVNSFKNLINFFTLPLVKDTSKRLNNSHEEKKSLVKAVSNMKISSSMPILNYEKSEPFSKFLSFVNRELKNKNQVINVRNKSIERLGERSNEYLELERVSDLLYCDIDEERKKCEEHVKTLTHAATLIEKLENIYVYFEEIKEEKKSKPETGQNNKELKDKEKILIKKISDLKDELQTYTPENIKEKFRGYIGEEKDVMDLLFTTNNFNSCLLGGLRDKVRLLESTVRTYVVATDKLEN